MNDFTPASSPMLLAELRLWYRIKMCIDVRFDSGEAYSGNFPFQSLDQPKFCSTSNEKYLQDVYLEQ
jgi:hypothetical protein